MEILHKKNTAYYLAIPVVDKANPNQFLTGESPSDTAYYKDGAGSWTSLAISDTFSEVGSTGVYDLILSASELNHDYVFIKITSTNGADSFVLFHMKTNDIDSTLTANPGSGGIVAASFGSGAIGAAAIAADAIGSSEFSQAAAQKIRDEILSDATKFAGANVNATISSRSSHSAGDVWSVATRGLTEAVTLSLSQSLPTGQSADTVGLALENALDFLDALISSRSSHSASDVDTELISSHGGGSWETATGFSTHSASDAADSVWSAVSRTLTDKTGFELSSGSRETLVDEVWDEAIAGHVGAGTFGAKNQNLVPSETLGDYKADVSNLDAAVSSRSSHSPGDVDTELSSSHGAGSWESATGFPSAGDVADAVWDEAKAGHVAVGSFGEEVQSHSTSSEISSLNNLSAQQVWEYATRTLSGTLGDLDNLALYLESQHGGGSWETAVGFPSAGDVAVAVWEAVSRTLTDKTGFELSSGSRETLVDEVWDEAIAGHIGAGTFGAKNQRVVPSESVGDYKADVSNLDAAVSSRSSHSAADVDTVLSSSHGAGSWETASGFPTVGSIVDAVWDELKAEHMVAGSFGEEVQSHSTSSEISSLNNLSAQQVWEYAARALTDKDGFSISGSKTTLDALNDISTGDVSSQVAAVVQAYRLHELLADALSGAPAAGALFGDLTEDDAGVRRFTANALEQAPTGSGGGLTAQEVWEYASRSLTEGVDVTSLEGQTLSALVGENFNTFFQNTGLSTQKVVNDVGAGLTGQYVITFTFEDGLAQAIPDVFVMVRDAAGEVLITTTLGDANGTGVVSLSAGTYQIYLYRSGYSFSNPETLEVTEDAQETYQGEAVVIGSPAMPESCRIYEYCFDQSGEDHPSSVVARARIISHPYDDGEGKFSTDPVDGTYDAQTGVVYWDIVVGALVWFEIEELGVSLRATVPEDSVGQGLRLGDLTTEVK